MSVPWKKIIPAIIIAVVVIGIAIAIGNFQAADSSKQQTASFMSTQERSQSASKSTQPRKDITNPTEKRPEAKPAEPQRNNSAKPYPSEKNSAPKKGFEDFPTCEVLDLPVEAEETIDDILAGGPYLYPNNDNRRFGNYEQVLPKNNKNYYREYTVETPGLRHRGERRIVTGGGTETDPEVWLYTDDHYESFCLIPDAEY
ncbi:MAG: ribonuclease domain-containing protein [Corynebacterium sp.]|uniref:ribonuclease domain-containing protein n=1 Tax=Corynebacterium sp. TaxID=1720 RepID=UPI0026DA853B|nr:ribonuclease domain-containing protein [Corynebacterium sp.]MDO5098643.1 ribonuclease domain-containing protein [Corynebacterium sp.]